MEITLTELKNLRACKKQLRLFEKKFGESVIVTAELCEKHAQVFDWVWAAYHFFDKNQQKQFDDAVWKHYNVLRQHEIREFSVYQNITAPSEKAWSDALERRRNPLCDIEEAYIYLDARNEAIQKGKAAFEAAIAPHKAAYNVAVARTFAEIALS